MCSLDEYEEMNGAEKNKEKKGKSKEQLKKKTKSIFRYLI